ncbi:MAG: Xaa-Pro dipeptidyl-peptidase [Bacteroidales bacterium]|nr:Xaa-Pro dipeptidyl-peptidase [Bacteroidales bacterium]
MKKLTFCFVILLVIPFSVNAQQSEVTTDEKTVPVFENGEAQIVPGFSDHKLWITHDLWVETEFDTDGDGKPDRMHTSVTRPYQTETEGLKLPVIYESSPYYAGVAWWKLFEGWDVEHELGELPEKERKQPHIRHREKRPELSGSQTRTWIPRGYIVVHSSSPGTGMSDGSPTCGGDNESLAQKAVIDWLCGRAHGYTAHDGNEKVEAYWCSGKVGMTGTSYNGTLAVAAATTGVDGLEAIIPVSPGTSYYHYYRSNGLVRSPGGYLGEDMDVLYDFIHSGFEEKRAYSDSVIRNGELAAGMDRITGDYNEFWDSRDLLNDIGPMKAAMLMSHGFNDWNVMPEHSYRFYKAAKEKGLPVQIYYHQYGHGGPPPLGMMNRWFTHYLHGVENGVEDDPRAWIVREYDPRSNPTPYEGYPNPEAYDVTLYMKAGNPEQGQLVSEKPESQGTESLVDDYSFSGKKMAKGKGQEHRLIYATEPLTDNVHISGVPRITIRLASSKPAANLSVWMISLPWEGGRKTPKTDNIITRGWADPQNYKSLTESEPLEPGKFYEVSFDLIPDDQIIHKGQQIGLMIFSSDKQFTIHPESGTELTIDLDGTLLTLPVVGGNEAWKSAFGDN